jgi:hypothetical protein
LSGLKETLVFANSKDWFARDQNNVSAFDKVSHERLAAKLHHYRVRGPTLNWIKSFLAGRTQRVIVEGVASDPAPVAAPFNNISAISWRSALMLEEIGVPG